MPVEVRMPNLGYGMETGTIAAWHKAVGETVARGEVIAEIETDKATVEMESLQAGTLTEIVVAAGSEAAVGAVVAYLD